MSAYDEWVKAMTTPEAVERARRWYLEDLARDLGDRRPMPPAPVRDPFVAEQEERAWRQQYGTSMRFLGDPVTGFAADDRRLAGMHGYRPVMAINLRGPREPEVPSGFLAAVRRAFWRIRREVWTVREAALRGERWEGIG